jgi:hypothetical protein
MLEIEFMQKDIQARKDIIRFLEKAGGDSRDIQIKYAGAVQSLDNYLKNFRG